jgi:hypothetical protein
MIDRAGKEASERVNGDIWGHQAGRQMVVDGQVVAVSPNSQWYAFGTSYMRRSSVAGQSGMRRPKKVGPSLADRALWNAMRSLQTDQTLLKEWASRPSWWTSRGQRDQHQKILPGGESHQKLQLMEKRDQK